ncbi:uncharacterized protein J3R85_014147 [Psidium guajava]|nr:uncharacterized protein J3R85_014147 [Psidium guajava]
MKTLSCNEKPLTFSVPQISFVLLVMQWETTRGKETFGATSRVCTLPFSLRVRI